GEWEDYPNFIDCTMFGARADALSRILAKGTKVAIEGKLRWSSWERDGQKRSKIEVIVDEVEFLSQRNGGQQGGGYQQNNGGNYQNYSAPAPARAPEPSRPPVQTPPSADIYDEDIPF
ncbi:MAG: single-stranded DNA-binding protein, partial [Parafannyhessea umbonata]|nr:single-stranded DNA-binding protein [Parafannyhessea umbonata]